MSGKERLHEKVSSHPGPQRESQEEKGSVDAGDIINKKL
jgi:hypothetical protein